MLVVTETEELYLLCQVLMSEELMSMYAMF